MMVAPPGAPERPVVGLVDGVAIGCVDGDGAVGLAGDGVAAFFEPVVPSARGQSIDLFRTPATE